MRRDKHRPRRVLFLALVLFLLSQLALGLWLDHAAPLFRFTSLRAVLARLESSGIQPDTVVLGSSRLEGAIQEREAVLFGVLSLFNAAVPAGDPTAQEAVWERLLAAGVRPRRVIVEVCPEFFTRANFCAGWNALRLHRWADLPRHLDQILATHQLGRVITARLVPVYSYRDLFWQELRGSVGPWEARPLALAAAPTTHWQEPALEPIQIHQTPQQAAAVVAGGQHAYRSWLKNYRMQSINVVALHRLIAKARRLGAEVWLMTPPLSLAHRQHYTPEIESAYQALLAGTGCRHLDCRDWMEEEHFVDSHHLSLEAGRLFTRRWLREVLRPSLDQTAAVPR
ncbi:MAG: hypothetical protein SNJ82_02720 [Gemmataceae bacterium]